MKMTERVKLLVTIVDRGQGTKAVDIYRAEQLYFDFACLGIGTATSKILNYFGLAETEKEVVLTLVPASRVEKLIREAEEKLHLKSAGRGILFTCPLSGISGQVPQILIKEKSEDKMMNEQTTPLKSSQRTHELVVVIVNRGYTEQVMDAARSSGAGGGTAINARRIGYEDTSNLLGFTIQPEKEIIAILTEKHNKLAVMQAINDAAGLSTECRGIVLSLPVDEILGLSNSTNLETE